MTMDVSYASSANPAVVKLDLNNPALETEPSASFAQLNPSNETPLVDEAEPLADDAEALHDVANELTDMMSLMRKGLAFKVDEYSGQSVVSVMDVDSGNVLRQIPNEEALELAQKLAEVAGFLLKTEA